MRHCHNVDAIQPNCFYLTALYAQMSNNSTTVLANSPKQLVEKKFINHLTEPFDSQNKDKENFHIELHISLR